MKARWWFSSSLAVLAIGGALIAPMLRPVSAAQAVEVPVGVVVPPTVAPLTTGPVHVRVTPDREVVHTGGDRNLRLKVELWADPGTGAALPTDLVVVVDRSGSMSGDKILDARAATHALIEQLGPEDRFGLVSFSDDARRDVALEGRAMEDRAAWTRQVNAIGASGGTNMSLGLALGLADAPPEAGRVRRVVLISDGLPNTRDGLIDQARGSGQREIPVTTIGIGNDYDEQLMQALADAGTGNFYWVQRGPELQTVLANELATGRETVASGLRLDLRDGASLVGAAGFPVQEGQVQLGSLFAGQRRTLWLDVHVPAGADVAEFDLGSLGVSWRSPNGVEGALVADAGDVKLTADRAVALRSLGDDWAASVVNEDYNFLKTQVAQAVRSGDKASAIAAIDTYVAGNELMNAFALNPIVADNLDEAARLAADVEQQFQGDDQSSKQNLWSKTTSTSALDGRRMGQKK